MTSPLDHEQLALRETTRRHFFRDCQVGLGSIALASLMGRMGVAAEENGRRENPLAPRRGHHPARAKNVIFLFMAGGPSHLELFDYKPKLQQLDGEQVPESFVENKRFAFIPKDAPLLGTNRKFRRYGECGAEIAEVLPHIGAVADDIAIVRSMRTEVFNHGPAKLFLNTGAPQFMGRPSMGSWITYGIGSEANDLPGFVVLQSGPRGPRGGSAHWASGFLPTTYQGVPFLPGTDPILNLANPQGIDRSRQGEFVETVAALNRSRYESTLDPEIRTRIAAYEMAYRMQSSAPELMDLAGETKSTLDLYGIDDPRKHSYARNCLLARRLVEKGTRFVQLYHTDWDDHGNPDMNIEAPLTRRCGEIDQPTAGLIRDLKQRGLLEDTLIVWGGEFGRTPQSEARRKDLPGRDHHIDAFTMFLAGGGIQGGAQVGQSDELGFYVAEDPVHVHDLHATMLHLLGIDHLRLTHRFQGRDFRLTDVAGNVVEKLLA